MVDALGALTEVHDMYADLILFITFITRTCARSLPDVDQVDDGSVLRDAPSAGKVSDAVVGTSANR